MKDRIELLAGLVSEDDLDETRDRVVESYEQQLEEDVKEFSKHVSVIQEDKYIFAKLLSERNQPDMEDKYEEYTSLPLSAIEALESMVQGGDELVRHNDGLRDELLKREFLFLDAGGKFTLTDKAFDFIGMDPVSETYSYRMNNGSNFVEPREDHYDDGETPRMHSKNPEYPTGWKFYENDPTYLKLVAQSEDPLDLEETEYLSDQFAKFIKKYEKKQKGK